MKLDIRKRRILSYFVLFFVIFSVGMFGLWKLFGFVLLNFCGEGLYGGSYLSSNLEISENICERTEQYLIYNDKEDLRRIQDINNEERDILYCNGYNIQLKEISFEGVRFKGNILKRKEVLRVEFEVYNLSDEEIMYYASNNFKCLSEVNGEVVENRLYIGSGVDNLYSYPVNLRSKLKSERIDFVIKPNSSNTFVVNYILEDKNSSLHLYYSKGNGSVAEDYIEICRVNEKGFYNSWS